MFIKELVSFYDKHGTTIGMPCFGYLKQRLKYIITLDIQGKPIGLRDTKYTVQVNNKNKSLFSEYVMPMPGSGRGSGSVPCILWDNTEYVLGISSGDTTRAITKKRHAAFIAKVIEISNAVNHPNVTAVKTFISNNPLSTLTTELVAKDASFSSLIKEMTVDDKYSQVGFEVEGTEGLVTDLDCIKEYVLKDKSSGGITGTCCITGEKDVALLTSGHSKISTKVGNAALVSAGRASFKAFSCKELYKFCPIGLITHDKYVNALGYLGNSDKHYTRISDGAIFLYWSDTLNSSVEELFSEVVSGKIPDTSLLKELLETPNTGRYTEPDTSTMFYCGILEDRQRFCVRGFTKAPAAVIGKNIVNFYNSLGGHSKKILTQYQIISTLFKSDSIKYRAKTDLINTMLFNKRLPGYYYMTALGLIQNARFHDTTTYDIGVYKSIINHVLRSKDMDIERSTAYKLGVLYKELVRVCGDNSLVAKLIKVFSRNPARYFSRVMNNFRVHEQEGNNFFVKRILADLDTTSLPDKLNAYEQGEFMLGFYSKWDKAVPTAEEKLEKSVL